MATAYISGRMSLPAAAAIGAIFVAGSAFGIDGNQSFREGFIEEVKLMAGGRSYELYMHCGDMRKTGVGKSLLKGFLGGNRYSFRAWDDNHARRKANSGLKPGCRLTSLYRDESWFSDRQWRVRI